MRRLLAVRLDNAGDVLLAGPAIRAMAAGCDELVVLAGPQGAEAARLLPGVDDVMVWPCPWIDSGRPLVDGADIRRLVDQIGQRSFDGALIFTSFHQSALPTALLLRLGGVSWVGAISDDYPGTLLDLRHRVSDNLHETQRALSLSTAAGLPLPTADDGRLDVRRPLPDVAFLVGSDGYVVLHPGTSVPARAWPVRRFAECSQQLVNIGWRVVVTGAPSEAGLTRAVASAGSLPQHASFDERTSFGSRACPPLPGPAGFNRDKPVDLGGRTSLPQLAAVLDRAAVVVAANTGPAHLAAAVGTPVVSLFAPTVPAVRWAPYGVPHVLLGDQQAACRETRATWCQIPGHPCLTSVTAHDVCEAVTELAGRSQVEYSSSQPKEVAQ